MRLKSAPLNLILEANGKMTGDQLLQQQREDAKAKMWAEIYALPKGMTSRQRRALRKTLEKGALMENETTV